MIRYTYDVELGYRIRGIGGKFHEEHEIVKRLEVGRNVLFEYETATEEKRARDAIINYNHRVNHKKITTNIVGKTKVLVRVL